MAYDYKYLKVAIDRRVATVTIDNPPINLITWELFGELSELSAELAGELQRSRLERQHVSARHDQQLALWRSQHDKVRMRLNTVQI